MQVPPKIHLVSIEDNTSNLHECEASWRKHNPNFEFKIWRLADATSFKWAQCDRFEELLSHGELTRASNLLRWAILYNQGGISIESDLVCERPIPQLLISCQVALCWENELFFPGKLSTAAVFAMKGNRLIRKVIESYLKEETVEIVTNERFEKLLINQEYFGASVFPSHFFLPRHPKIPFYSSEASPIFGFKRPTIKSVGKSDNIDQFLSKNKTHFPGNRSGLPLITIGIANYNRASLVKKAIESALLQNYPKIEVLIVDDGSTDESVKVLESFTDERTRYISNKHSGIPTTLNILLSEARGSHILWLGNDDILIEGIVNKYAALLSIWPEISFAYGDLQTIDEEGEHIDILRYPDYFGDRLLLSRFLFGNLVPGPGSIANKEIMQAVGGFDNDIPYSNDYDMWVRLAATGLPFKHIGSVTCKYRRHRNNVSNQKEKLKADDLKVFKKMLARYDVPSLCADIDWSKLGAGAMELANQRISELARLKDGPPSRP
jgi:glycosyltransferase involved in cell wall biosynthesis